MIRSARWLVAAALLPIAACSNSSTAPTASASTQPALAAADAAFVNAAAASDAGEVQAAQVAATKAHNPRIKAYANKMIADHGQTTTQLGTIAQSKGVTPDTTLPPADQDAMAKLNAAAPRAFDREYMREQVASHQAAVKVYQDEIANGQDPDLKAYAQSTLPTIQAHLKSARALGGGGASPTAAHTTRRARAHA